MKHLSLRPILALALCICLAITLMTAFSPTRSAYAATTIAAACPTLNYAPGKFNLVAGSRDQWTTCKGNTMDLNMQTDGNFVLYMNGGPIWATNTTDLGFAKGVHAIFQSDGNLVVYDTEGNGVYAPWASNTNGKGATDFALQNDGNLVIYNASHKALWASNTCCH